MSIESLKSDFEDIFHKHSVLAETLKKLHDRIQEGELLETEQIEGIRNEVIVIHKDIGKLLEYIEENKKGQILELLDILTNFMLLQTSDDKTKLQLESEQHRAGEVKRALESGELIDQETKDIVRHYADFLKVVSDPSSVENDDIACSIENYFHRELWRKLYRDFIYIPAKSEIQTEVMLQYPEELHSEKENELVETEPVTDKKEDVKGTEKDIEKVKEKIVVSVNKISVSDKKTKDVIQKNHLAITVLQAIMTHRVLSHERVKSIINSGADEFIGKALIDAMTDASVLAVLDIQGLQDKYYCLTEEFFRFYKSHKNEPYLDSINLIVKQTGKGFFVKSTQTLSSENIDTIIKYALANDTFFKTAELMQTMNINITFDKFDKINLHMTLINDNPDNIKQISILTDSFEGSRKFYDWINTLTKDEQAAKNSVAFIIFDDGCINRAKIESILDPVNEKSKCRLIFSERSIFLKAEKVYTYDPLVFKKINPDFDSFHPLSIEILRNDAREKEIEMDENIKSDANDQQSEIKDNTVEIPEEHDVINKTEPKPVKKKKDKHQNRSSDKEIEQIDILPETGREVIIIPQNNIKEVAEQLSQNKTLPDSNADLFSELLMRLIEADRPGPAHALAKALAQSGSGGLSYWKEMLDYASGTDIKDGEKNGVKLYHAFDKVINDADPDPSMMALLVAAVLRCLFSPDGKHYDYDLVSLVDMIADKNNCTVLTDSPNTKNLMMMLKDIITNHPQGFSDGVLRFIRNDGAVTEEMRRISKEAGNMTEGKHVYLLKTGIMQNDYKQTIIACLGEKSIFADILNIIKNNEIEKTNHVKEVMRSFLINDEEKDKFVIDPDAVDSFIEQTFLNIVKVGKNKNNPYDLKYGAKEQLTKKINSVLTLIIKWLDCLSPINDTRHNESIQKLIMKKKEIMDFCQSAKEELEDIITKSNNYVGSAGIKILLSAIKSIQCALSGEIDSFSERWIYVEFLKTSYIELDDNFKPILDSRDLRLGRNENWRQICRHLTCDDLDFPQVVEEIFRSTDNYGNVEKILQYMDFTGRNTEIDPRFFKRDILEKSIERVRSGIEKEIDEFKSNYELAYAHGRINNEQKDTILQEIDYLRSKYEGSNNFGLLRNIISNFQNQIEEWALTLKKDYLERFEILKKEKAEDFDTWPILKDIQELINDDRFVIAEELMILAEDGGYKINPYHADGESEKLYEDFLEIEKRYFDALNRNRESNLSKMRETIVSTSKAQNLATKDERSAVDFIKAWSSSTSRGENIQTILENLGFDVISATRATCTDKKSAQFNVKVIKPPVNRNDYPHPIPAFGTQMSGTITVVFAFGIYNATEILNKIKRINPGQNSIVLLDAALSPAERRKLAKEFKTSSALQNSFLFVDRVLALYISLQTRENRPQVFLRCTLPYTYNNPYSIASGKVAEEMFFGRRKEIIELIGRNGKCLVYGGRQMGKTALLRRVESRVNNKEKKEYAIYIDIKSEDCGSALGVIVKAIRNSGLEIPDCSSWSELREHIVALLNGKAMQKAERIILLLDEADKFLADSEDYNDDPIYQIKQMHADTDFAFKCIFAGLHNVVRFSGRNKNNGDLAHFGVPICVNPLNYNDAVDLIERPLRYLGFSIEDQNILSLILSHTNYYPGLIHFYCNTLLNSHIDKYSTFFDERESPPYKLKESHIKEILQNNQLNEEIKNKFFLTINLDVRYLALAYTIALLALEVREVGSSAMEGFNVKVIMERINIFPQFSGLLREQVTALLDEMQELGILRKPIGMDQSYLFNRLNFLSMFGNRDTVENKILEIAAGERNE